MKKYKDSPKVKKAVKYANAFHEQFLEDLMQMNVLEIDALSKSYDNGTVKEMIMPVIAQSKKLKDSLNNNPLAELMKGGD